jgi:hypothetical protein
MTKPAVSPSEGNIVPLRRADPVNSQPRPITEQLRFALEDERKLVILVTERIHGATFLRSVMEFRPRVAVDVRFAPHFEFTAVPSALIKQTLESVVARYVLYTIPFHDFSPNFLRHNPLGIAEDLIARVFEAAAPAGPLLMLVHRQADAEAFAPYLAAALSRVSGGSWKMELVR